jgi:hypothetical protein
METPCFQDEFTLSRNFGGKMGKKSIVVEIVEKRLSPYGFHYAAHENYRWRFSRKVGDVTQDIVIHRGCWGNDYTLEIDVGNWPYRLKDITNDPEYNLDFLKFNNQEELKAVLNKLLDAAEKYGIDKLDELMKEKKSIQPTVQMYKKLYKENSVLTQQFINRNNAADLMEEDILQLLKKELEVKRGEKYEDVQDKLVELSSVYGNMLIKKVGGRWRYTKNDSRTGVDIQLFCWCDVLEDFIEAWQQSEENIIIEKYNYKCGTIINWVSQCRRFVGDDWQPVGAKYQIPPM